MAAESILPSSPLKSFSVTKPGNKLLQAAPPPKKKPIQEETQEVTCVTCDRLTVAKEISMDTEAAAVLLEESTTLRSQLALARF